MPDDNTEQAGMAEVLDGDAVPEGLDQLPDEPGDPEAEGDA